MNVIRTQTRILRSVLRVRFPKYLRIKIRENHKSTYHLGCVQRKEMRGATGNRGVYGNRAARLRTRFFLPLRCNKLRNLECIFCAPYTLNVNVTTTLRYFTNLDRVCDGFRGGGDARGFDGRSPRNRYRIYAINTTGIKIGV